ncbi:MAG TPA: phosphatidylserine decarboxylase family protein [Bacteroidota bacterium]|nr:phosphatidylserine decarboxylase family protein [Bacteroidota bacterium]
MISKYGYDVVGTVVALTVLGTVLAALFVDARILRYGIIAVCVCFLLFTVYFFRDPDRTPPAGDNLVVSPADGEVVAIAPASGEEYIGRDAIRVSIFMSPLNVHVNRFPISGTVRYYRYVPGEYVVAFDEKASLRNERTLIGIENARCRILFKQIAGFVARRIVARVREGDTAVAGERFGMIKFGSRVDVFVPHEAAIRVALGQKTVGGETVLAVVP